MRNKTEIQFDTLKMKESIQKKIYSKIRHMNAGERIAYFEKSAQEGPLANLYRQLSGKPEKSKTTIYAREKKARYKAG